MAINQLKVVISLLREFSDGNIPTAADYEIAENVYWDIIEAMQDEGLIKGARFIDVDGGRAGSDLDNIKITIKGMEYLNQNSALSKTYKGLKEIREWLPF